MTVGSEDRSIHDVIDKMLSNDKAWKVYRKSQKYEVNDF